LKISFDIKTEVDSITNVDEDTLKFFTFIRGDFVDEPVMVLDQLVIIMFITYCVLILAYLEGRLLASVSMVSLLRFQV